MSGPAGPATGHPGGEVGWRRAVAPRQLGAGQGENVVVANGRYWIETLGCPKNQVDSDKLVGLLAADGYRPADDPRTPTWWSSTPARSSRPPARSPSTRSWSCSRASAAPGARLVVTGCMAERYGDELAAALPEVDLVAGSAALCRAVDGAVGPTAPASAASAPRSASARPPAPAGRRTELDGPPSTCWSCPARGHRAVGVRQGGRGLRPALRLLRHPVVPGRAALPAPATSSRGPSPRAPGTAVPRDRAGRPGPRLLRPGPHAGGGKAGRPRRLDGSRRRGADADRRPAGAVAAGAPDAAPLPLPLGAHRRPDRGHPRDRGARTSTCRCSTFAAAAARDAAVGRRRPVPRPHRPDPGGRARRRRSARRSSSATPARPRRTTTAARVPRGRAARLGRASSPSPPRRAPRRDLPDQVARRAGARAAAGVQRDPGRDHGRPPGPLVGQTRRCWSTPRGSAARSTRRPRSTGSSACPDPAGRVVGRLVVTAPSAPMSSPSPFDRTPARAGCRRMTRSGRVASADAAGSAARPDQTFGPSALATPANALTVARLWPRRSSSA